MQVSYFTDIALRFLTNLTYYPHTFPVGVYSIYACQLFDLKVCVSVLAAAPAEEASESERWQHLLVRSQTII